MNISEHAEGMLSYKESLGFSRNSYDYYLRDFCDYFSQNDYSLGTAAGLFKSVVSILLIFIANAVAKRYSEERLF